MIKIDLNSINWDDVINLHLTNPVCKSKELLQELLHTKKIDKSNLSKKDIMFLKKLFGEKGEKISNFCISKNLEKLINDFDIAYKTAYNKKFTFAQEYKMKQKPANCALVKNILDYILGYKRFNEGNLKWNRHIFIDKLNIKVCPYCNRNYITSFNNEEKVKTSADADHYYIKSLYPILQMNIYNLIPSCSVCNSRTKGTKDIRHFYPYDNKDILFFSTHINTVDDLYSYDSDNIKIDLEPVDDSFVDIYKSTLEAFKLDEIYKAHKEVVNDLMVNYKLYLEYDNLYEYFTQSIGIKNSKLKNLQDRELFKSILFDFLGKNPLNEPLVKLNEDIYRQLKTLTDNIY